MRCGIFNTMAGLSVVAVLGIAGCGSGEGSVPIGSSASYTGKTSQAVVTTGNATALSSGAYQGAQTVSAAGAVGKGVITPSSPHMLELADILENSVRTVVNKAPTAAKAAALPTTTTINGVSGYYTYTLDDNQETGAFTGNITYHLYKQYSSSATINGTIYCYGVYDQVNQQFSTITMDVHGLTGDWGNNIRSITGTLSITTTGITKTIIISAILLDSSTNSTYWLKDFVFVFNGTALTMSGTYYDPLHGYVIISTVTPLTSPAFSNAATSGQLLFTGANGSKARLTFTNTGEIVEVDVAGNNTFVIV